MFAFLAILGFLLSILTPLAHLAVLLLGSVALIKYIRS